MCSSHSREFCGWNWTSFTLQFTCSRPSWFVVLGVGATSISTMQGHALRRIAPNRKNECFGESSGAFGGLHGHLKEWHIYAECYNLQKEMVNTSEGHYHQCNSCHDIGQQILEIEETHGYCSNAVQSCTKGTCGPTWETAVTQRDCSRLTMIRLTRFILFIL